MSIKLTLPHAINFLVAKNRYGVFFLQQKELLCAEMIIWATNILLSKTL